MTTALRQAVGRVEQAAVLDGPGKAVQHAVNAATRPTPLKNALNGTWLGHPAHPLFTDLPLGAWSAGVTLDWIGGKAGRKAADRLIALGCLAAIPTAATGAAQYSDFNDGPSRRVGLVHAAANVAALGLFTASWLARRRGQRWRGKALGLAGVAAQSAGGWLGGYLAYDLGLGVKRTAFQQPGSSDWADAASLDSLTDGKPHLAHIEGVDVVLVRDGADVRALANTCTHMGGPLHEGSVEGDCITCPWHGSTFRLHDGSVVRAPAVAGQPRYETRVAGGLVQVRPAQ
jgi:nitrite reductase/ring-hydroxylating ferredoxin subunit/uncharacterized membrane protein